MFEINETFTVFSHGIERISEHLAKLNRKAGKIGLGGYKLTVGDSSTTSIRIFNEDSNKWREETVPVTDITIVGEYPTYDGWSLVATNEHDAETKMNILRSFPWAEEIEVPNRYRTTAAQLCEECGNNRQRKQTFIVTSESGDFKQVGSTCLKSFVGSSSARTLVSLLEAVETIYELAAYLSDGKNYYGTGGARMFDTDAVLAITAAAIEAYGWMSKGKAWTYDKVATASRVESYLMEKDDRLRDPELRPTDAHKKTAKDVEKWLVDLSGREGLDDYMWSLSALGARDAVTMRHFGLLCSAISTYNRVQEQEMERITRVNEHFGVVGKKYGTYKSKKDVVGGPVVMTVAFTGNARDNSFAYNAPPTYPNVLRDLDGRTFVWYTSRNLQSEYGQGAELEVSFKVKKHGEYDGTKQTIINYARMVEVDDGDEIDF